MLVDDDLIAMAINTRLSELQRACAIARLLVHENRRAHYEPYEERKRHVNIRSNRKKVQNAERALSEHNAKYRSIMGDDWAPNSGRLCWASVLGGSPIDRHYCDQPEGHDGPHSTPKGCWTDEDAAKSDRRWTIYERACHAAAVIKPTRFCRLPRVG